MKYIYIFIGIIVLKFITNFVKYLNGFRLEKIWYSYFSKNNVNAVTYTQEIQKYFKDANITDSNYPITIPTYRNMVANTRYSMYENIFSKTDETILWTNNSFLEAKGVYRNRMFNSFNPFYWIDFAIKLPKYIIEYLGLDTETVFTKFFQLIYWIINSVLLVYFREPIFNFISKLFE